MIKFLEETILSIEGKHSDLSQLTLVLPSKRAGGFLKNIFLARNNTTSFAPRILSIEEFIEELSDLKIIDHTELLFKSYSVYAETVEADAKEEFASYATWATTLLNDLSEMDRYMVDANPFFAYLRDIQALNKWNVKDSPSDLIRNYLKFWEQLPALYNNLHQQLLSDGLGYQGMVYRKAAEDIEHYISHRGSQQHIFIGFNALNTSEQNIIQALLETGNSEIYWDIEEHFLHNKNHGVSRFIRQYLNEWNYYKDHSPDFISNHYNDSKQIKTVAIQKNIGQAKYLGSVLANMTAEELANTAIVLGDESLLPPVLNSLPLNVREANVTMGLPMKHLDQTHFLSKILVLHKDSVKSFHYQRVLDLLNDPMMQRWIPEAQEITSIISKENRIYLTLENLTSNVSNQTKEILKVLFGAWKTGSDAVRNCSWLLSTIKNSDDLVNREYQIWMELFEVFKKLETLDAKYNVLANVKTVHNIYLELVSKLTMDFKGDAYNGLQIMGVLETRCLDFEHIILLSANEGILPSGKTNASFITYDLKSQFRLPLYDEKDAVYTYHFYKMLFRAKTATILYNSHSEGISAGEKSRFILQMEYDNLPQHSITHLAAIPQLNLPKKHLKAVSKNKSMFHRLEEIAAKGFSPSSLTSYIRNPMDFYYKKVLRIHEFEEVEETVAYNTLGTIVHDTLEVLYTPFLNQLLRTEELANCKSKIDNEVRNQFKTSFKEGDYSFGKNLIIFEIAKKYVENLIDWDLKQLKSGDLIKIIALEKELSTQVNHPDFPFPVFLSGKVDRIDLVNNELRIIDYKTGKVEQKQLKLSDWNELTQDEKYSKAFQVLTYSFMWLCEHPEAQLEAGIISFKNLKEGFLKFTSTSGNSEIDGSKIQQETNRQFEPILVSLISEILDPEVPFTEKEINEYTY